MTASLVWLRQDLRLDDNPALRAALDRGAPVIPVYVWAPEEEGQWAPGSASRWWLHQSLKSLAESLEKHGSRLVLRKGPTLGTLRQLVRESGATAVFWNRRYEPKVIERDSRIKKDLKSQGVEVESHNASLLFEPWEVQTGQGRPYQVYTPFWKACDARGAPPEPHGAARRWDAPAKWPGSLPLADLALEPRIDWASGMRAEWTPGEGGALQQLRHFLTRSAESYADTRDRPDRDGTSCLSPHLHFGEISPRRVWHGVVGQFRPPGRGSLPRGPEVYLKELGWREFAHHSLYYFPDTPDEALRPEYTRFPWKRNAKTLKAWQRGETGYPIVDAGMRQLWSVGWVHNRVRMVVASFLVKHLLTAWREGAAWFWDTLVDADLANNTLNWQWSAGCGADAAPFFRIFNPVMQGERFDAGGAYVARWVPELAKLPARWIHKPWEAPAEVLREAEVFLGKSYPRPVVDHAEARARALAALQTVQKEQGDEVSRREDVDVLP